MWRLQCSLPVHLHQYLISVRNLSLYKWGNASRRDVVHISCGISAIIICRWVHDMFQTRRKKNRWGLIRVPQISILFRLSFENSQSSRISANNVSLGNFPMNEFCTYCRSLLTCQRNKFSEFNKRLSRVISAI